MRVTPVLIVALALSCTGAKEESTPTTVATPVPVVEITVLPAMSTTRADDPAPPRDPPTPAVSCQPALRITGPELTTRWPALLGRRVRLLAEVERALDFTDSVLTADGARVVVTMSPDALWSGTQLHTFEVIGSQSVALHGHAVLLHLLADEDSCP